MSTPIEKLKQALPHLLCGFKEAAEHGKPIFVIASQFPDGGGKMMLTLDEPEEFLRDICEIAGIAFEPTDEAMTDYSARKFLSQFGK